ncbi:hypothetical protein D3C75_566480 [compost metagenome]
MNYYEEFYNHPTVRFNVNMSFIGIALTCIYFDWIRTSIGFILGVVLFAVFEYFAHRYVYHHYALAVLKKVHLKHHQDPENIKHLFFSGSVGLMYCLYVAHRPITPGTAFTDSNEHINYSEIKSNE